MWVYCWFKALYDCLKKVFWFKPSWVAKLPTRLSSFVGNLKIYQPLILSFVIHLAFLYFIYQYYYQIGCINNGMFTLPLRWTRSSPIKRVGFGLFHAAGVEVIFLLSIAPASYPTYFDLLKIRVRIEKPSVRESIGYYSSRDRMDRETVVWRSSLVGINFFTDRYPIILGSTQSFPD